MNFNKNFFYSIVFCIFENKLNDKDEKHYEIFSIFW